MVPAAMALVQASVQCAAVKITNFWVSLYRRLPLQLMRAVFVALMYPLTEATFGYSLLVSGLPQVMARALDTALNAKAKTTSTAKSFVRISYFLSGCSSVVAT